MKMLQRLTMFMLALMLTTTAIVAQRTINGTVTDTETNEPLIGASVVVKGTLLGVITDLAGKYKLEVPANAETLVFSFVGYTSKEVAITDNTIDVALGTGLELQNIVVIGSRNPTRTKLETPVPVDVIPLQTVVNEVGQIDINQILTYVAPSFQSSRQAIADGTDHVDPAQLRGLGPDQVLVLVNGKRRHQSSLVNVNGTVNRGTVGTDMNAIPATAVDRIEVLRDGAAAQYGSDAIAGVINIVLKKSEGLNAVVSYGTNVTSYDKNYAWKKLNPTAQLPSSVSVTDGGALQLGLSYGLKVGAGHLNVMGEYTARGATNRTGTYTGRLYSNVGGLNRDDSIMAARGLNRNSFDMAIGQSDVKGIGVMYNFAYPVSDNIEIYSFGGYNNKKGIAAGFYRFPTGASTNAIPAASNALTVYPNGFLPEIESDVTDLSFSAGLRGKISDWNYDLSHVFGNNTFDFVTDNSINYSQGALAGAAGVAALPRTFNAGGTGFTQNTTNLDISRNYADIMAGLNVAVGAEYRTDAYKIVAGEEASWKNYAPSSGVAAGAQVFGGFLPGNAGNNKRSNIAGYLDTELDITKAFMVGAALRFENYSDFGSTLNYKAVARYKVTDNISLRGSISTGFRAPSQQQKYYSRTGTLFVNINGVSTATEAGTFTNSSAAAKAIGIPELKQETSQHYTLGATARLAEGLDFSLDAYQIDIKNRIVLTNNFGASAFTGADTIVRNQLRAANAETVNFFTNAVSTRARGIEGVLSYDTKFDNQSLRVSLALSAIKNNVIDSSNVAKPFINATQKLIDNKLVSQYFNREDESRFEVAVPLTKAALTINYKVGKFGVMLRNTYFGKVQYLDPTVTSTNIADSLTNAAGWPKNDFTGAREILDQTFAAKIVTDLTLNYEVMKGLSISLGANNLFDVYQDQHTHSGNMSFGRFLYSRRVQQMGFNGRYVFGRLIYNFK